MENRITLSDLQDRVYKIFVEFDRICRKHDIKYSIEGGTLMGAVKFSDFVPWDDDIDVIMKREEYNKFLKIAPRELGNEFFLQSYNNVNQFPLNYAKICMNKTEIYDYDYSHLKKMHHGIFMDIFPIDNVIPDKLKRQCSFIGVLTGARKTKLKIDFGVRGRKLLIYKVVSLLPMKILSSLITFFCTIYNRKDTGYIYEVCNSNKKFAPLKKDIYENYTNLRFRQTQAMSISEYDSLLKSRFGENYMNCLPAQEDRKPSHNQNIRIL